MKQWEEGQENGEENGKIVDGVIIKQELPDYGTQMNGQPIGEQILFFLESISNFISGGVEFSKTCNYC